jgi:hypothetical protein
VRNGYGARIPSTGRTAMSAAKSHPASAVLQPAAPERPRGIPTAELGWTKEMVAEARRRLASIADDWDDPAMDVYDAEP